MIKINESPVLTSKNYNVNYFELDEKILYQNFNNLINVEQKNEQHIIQNKLINLPHTLLHDKLDMQIQNNCNFAKSYIFNTNTQKPFELNFNNNKSLAESIDVLVNSEVNAKTIFYFNTNDTMYHNGVLKITVKENANLDLAIMYDMNSLSNNFISIEAFCDTNSQLNLNIFDFGAQNSVQKLNVNLNGNLSKVNINSVYFGNNNNRLSLNYLINVYGEKCSAKMDACGVLSENAYKNFLGTINFERGSSKSIGSENEHCVMLSNTAKTNSTPILLSGEEDIDGKHSSSIGKIDNDELFYIMSRGISKQEAIKMLVKAKLANISNKLFDEDLKNRIIKRIEEKIDEQNK